MGYRPAPGAEPAPVDLALPKTGTALKKLFAKRFGKEALNTFESRFEQANPPPPPKSAAGRLLVRLGGLFKARPKPLAPEEAARLKGADLNELLYRRLLTSEKVTEADLSALGKARGDAILARLKADGVAAERLSGKPPVATNGIKDHEVPAKLTLGVAGTPKHE